MSRPSRGRRGRPDRGRSGRTPPRIAGARQGAAILILDEDEQNCLAISRGGDTDDWNLPGGHCEPGETPIQAAIRELDEETGITVTPSNLQHVYTSGTAHVFMATDFFRWPQVLKSAPFEGYVTWKPLHALCRPSCTFHQHANRLFSQLGLR